MSNARSPREVCSTTIGTSGLIVLASFASSAGFLPNVATARPRPGRASAPRRPELARAPSGVLLAGLPQLLAGLGLLDRDRLRLAHEQLERLARGHVAPDPFQPIVGPKPLHQLFGRGSR